MKTFNSDSMAILASKSEDKPTLNLSFDKSNYSEIEPSVIPFQLLDSSSKRLTDIYFLLHPEDLEFTDPENLAKFYNNQVSHSSPLGTVASDTDLLDCINSRYNSNFEDIHQFLKYLDEDSHELSKKINVELQKEKDFREQLERFTNGK